MKAKGLILAKFGMDLNNMERMGQKGSLASIFWGRTVGGGGVPNLGRRELDVAKIKKPPRTGERVRPN